MKYKTEQEIFWAGEFGNNYIARNASPKLLASNLHLFSTIFSKTTGVKSVLELGANIGMNILAINKLLPESITAAIEINAKACKQLKNVCTGKVYLGAVPDICANIKSCYDFIFIKGVLIHMNPDQLAKVYDVMYRMSKKYICVAEYYNPSPISIDYRGEKNKLFKRDFAGEMLRKYRKLSLVDYGFVYHGDNNYPQDDITWFLLRK